MCPAIDQPLQLDAKQLEQAMKSQAITVSELARRSGVSRTAIHGLLRGGRKRVQKRTFDRVAQTLDLRPDQLSAAGALGKYLDWVVRQNAELDFAGFGIVHLDRLPLEDLFVPMEVEESLEAETSGLPEMLAVALGQQVRRPTPAGPPRRMETAEAAAGYPRLVLTGAPGSGKTTLARHLAGAAARALAEGKPGNLPLLVRLVEYDRASEELGALDPAGYVAAWVRQDKGIDVEPLLRERLESGACIVLLDGLDEVARDRPGEPLARRLEEFIRRYPGNQYLLTARQQGFDRGPWSNQGFRQLDLVPWDDGRIEQFVRNWVRATGRVGKGRGAHKEEDRLVERLQSEFRSAPGIRPLTSNPLMLAVLVAMHFAYGALPRRRAEVYAKLVETFLESWEKAKFSARPGDVLCGTPLEGREYGWLLEDLALQMQHNDAAVAPRWWLADQVARFLGEGLGLGQEAAKRECDRVLQYLGDRSGLLVERGPGLFGFSHLTFQEFFAARAMIRQSAGLPGRGVVEALRPYLYHPRWSEVVRLVCAQLPPPQTGSLVRSILDDPDPIGRFLHRGPILALRCLGDGAAIAEPGVLDQVFSSVHDLGQSRWLGITLQVFHLLENLEKTRCAEQAKATLEAMLAAAKASLSTEDYLRLRKPVDREFRQRLFDAILDHDRKGSPLGTRFTVDCDGFPVTFYHLARRLRAERPEEWLQRAEKVLLSTEADEDLKGQIARQAASIVKTTRKARDFFLAVLRGNPSGKILGDCTIPLMEIAAQDASFRSALLALFKGHAEESVRLQCGSLLVMAAKDDAEVHGALLDALVSNQPPGMRAGAALGLDAVCEGHQAAREALHQAIKSPTEHPVVQMCAACALALSLGTSEEVTDTVAEFLYDETRPYLRIWAACGFAKALAEGRVAWEPGLASEVGRVLMETPDHDPIALKALRLLLDARERRAGLRMEGVLAEAMEGFGGAVEVAMVFGSVARLAQDAQSDVDLLVVGEVTLRQLAEPLDRAQTVLGRRINPVVYDPATLRAKYQDGNPFVHDVLRREKIWIKGSDDALGDLLATASAGSDRS